MAFDEQSGEEIFQQFREYVAGVCNDSSIEDKRTIREIFGAIRDKWDLNGNPYDLLLQVMEGVDDAELIECVEEAHEKYYTQYLVATKVADHIIDHKMDAPEDLEYRPNFTRLSMKLGKVNVNDCSMAYLVDLWKAVKRCVQLPDLFSVLAAIEEGSLIVTWLVPVYAIPALMRLPRSSPKLFRKFSILRMTINGVCFYEVRNSGIYNQA